MHNYEFCKEIKITFPECDVTNRLRISGIMRHIQEVSGEHLEALGLHHRLLWEEGFVYLLTKVGLRLTRRPRALEKLTLITKPRQPKGVQSVRDVYFYDEAGREIIYAQTGWVLTDPVQHKIRRPSELPHRIAVEPVEVSYELVKSKIKRPNTAVQAGVRTVQYSDIDCNLHMNNAVYSDIVCDQLPLALHRSLELAEYDISFVGEVGLGDELAVLTAPMGENTYYVGADRPAGDCCFEAVAKYRALTEEEANQK